MKDTFLSRFTPSLMAHETLEAIFIQREKLAQDLVERIRDSVLTDSKHHTLLIGPRGIGKTHLVALVYHRVKELEELRNQLCVAWLREEEWGITSFMDLLLRVLRALEEEHPDADLSRAIEAIYELSSRDEAERAAAELLRSHVGDRTLLILMENLGDIFDGLGEEGQQQLRAFLQNHSFATILATSQSLFGGVSVKTSPFYGFFNVHHLKPFDLDEATDLLATLALLDGDEELADFILTPKGRARIRAVHHLAGGNPRVYVILSQFLTREALDALVEPFMNMLDDMTPYYQARMQWLSPQQRKIVEYLIERRHAVPVKDIAQRAFTSHQSISSQLRSLRDMGYVRSISVGRESLYELREPLMRMCVEVKKHRGKPIRLFVDFLRLWYTREELEKRLDMSLNEDDVERKYLLEALEAGEEQLDSPLLEACHRDLTAYFDANDFSNALSVAEEMVTVRGSAVDWLIHGTVLGNLGNYSEALTSFEKALDFQPDNHYAWHNRGIALAMLEKHGMALESYDHAIELQPDRVDTWRNRGVVLSKIGRYEDAIKSFNKAVALQPDDSMAWFNRGVNLGYLAHHEKALESYSKAIELEPEDAQSWSNYGVELGILGDYKNADSAFEKALELQPDFVPALHNRCFVLIHLRQWRESINLLDQTFSIVGGIDERWYVFTADSIARRLLSNVAPADYCDSVNALAAVYRNHDALGSLATGFQLSLQGISNIGDDTLRDWQTAWQAAIGDVPEYQLPLRLLHAVIDYRETEDPRILLDFPIEERELLQQILGIDAQDEA